MIQSNKISRGDIFYCNYGQVIRKYRCTHIDSWKDCTILSFRWFDHRGRGHLGAVLSTYAFETAEEARADLRVKMEIKVDPVSDDWVPEIRFEDHSMEAI